MPLVGPGASNVFLVAPATCRLSKALLRLATGGDNAPLLQMEKDVRDATYIERCAIPYTE